MLLILLFLPFCSGAQLWVPEKEGYLLSTLKDTPAINRIIAAADDIKTTEPDSALIQFQTAQRLSLQSGFTNGIISSMIKIGNVYREKSLFEEALKSYRAALSYCDSTTGSKVYLTAIYSNIGSVFNRQGKLQQAVFYYYQAGTFAEKYSSIVPVEIVYANLSIIYSKLEQLNLATLYSDKAELLFRKGSTPNKTWLATLLNNKGVLQIQLNDLNNAGKSFREALQIGREQNNPEAQLMALNNLAEIHLRQGEPDKALPLLKEAKMVNNANASFLTMGMLLTLGKTYFAQKKYNQAIPILEEVCTQSRLLQVAEIGMEAHEQLALLYAAKKNNGNALQHFMAYMKLKDSISGKEVTQNINQLEIKYQTAEKDKSIIQKQLVITRQQQSLERKNILLAGISTGTLAIVILAFFLHRNFRNRQRMLLQHQEIRQLKAMIKGEEKERSRIARELHDGIGGMLAAIKMNLGAVKKEYPEFRGSKKLENISSLLQNTSSEVRKTAHNLMPDVLTKHNLEEALGRYCDQINQSHELHLDLQFHGALNGLEKGIELILYRMTQELIQNIIKHADATHAAIQVTLYENDLSITVEDNGKGFDVLEQHLGSGLENLRFRVEALRGNLAIYSSEETGTTVHLKFDYKQLRSGYRS